MATSDLCNLMKFSPKISSHMNAGRKLYNLFNTLPNIAKVYGKIEKNKVRNHFAESCMTTLCERVLDGKPWDPSFTLERGDYVRIEHELKRLNKDLGKGTNLSAFATTTYTPRAIADRYPNMRKFLNNLDEIISFEKNNYNKISNHKSEVATGLKAAFISKNLDVKDILKKLNKSEQKLFESFMNGKESGDKMMKYISDMSAAVGTDGGEVLSDFFNVMENKKIVKTNKGTFIKNKDGSLKEVDNNILHAARSARNLLNDTGQVLIKGLNKSLDLSEMIYAGHSKNNRSFLNPDELKKFNTVREEITNAIANIKDGIENEDYFPHYVLADIMNVRRDIESNIAQNGKNSIDSFKTISKNLQDIRNSIADGGQLNRSKNRNDPVNQLWEKNPLAALERYSSDVVSFNKLMHMQSEYLQAIGNLENVDFKVAGSMREFIGHTFDTATKGYTERPGWVNKVTRAISAYEFASKLGFGVSTAIRNTLSGAFYLTHMGGKYLKYSNDFETSKFKNEIVKLEEEVGFKFLDASQTADELAAEGLLPSKGVRKDSLYFDTTSNDWKYEQDGVWKTVDAGINKVIGVSATFQRITENALRKRMFRASFMRALEIYESQDSYIKGKGTDEQARKVIYRKAAQTALASVNKFAFAYDVFNKSVSIGGTHKTGGAVGQMLGIFMHYPMAFANLQVKTFKDAAAALKTGQGMSNTDAQLAMGFMGIYLTTTLMSGVTGMDMAFWLNNDTADRIQDIYKYMNEEDENKRDKITFGAGPAGLVSGPFIGDARKVVNGLVHSAVALDFINKPDNEFLDFLTDYEKFADMNKDDKTKYFLRMINNQGFKIGNNIIPAFRDNNPGKALMQEFRIYNTEDTQNIRKGINKATESVFGKKYLNEKPATNREKAAAELNTLLSNM